MPVRLCTLLSLAVHISIFLWGKIEPNIIATVVALIHLSLAYLLLKECFLSVKYHKLLQSGLDPGRLSENKKLAPRA